MSALVASQMRFVGSLTPESDASQTITFNGTGEQVVIPQNTAWVVSFVQAHSVTAGAGAASATLQDLSSGSVFARIELTGQGSFAIENQGHQISPIIRPTTGSQTLTFQVAASSGSEEYCGGANLRQVYSDPAV